MNHEAIYLLTDGCLWETNKQTGNEHPHSVEVVDTKTGAVRYIKSGSRIRFVDGEISDLRTQEAYNKATEKEKRKMPSNGQDLPERTKRKGTGLCRKVKREVTGI